MFVKSSALFFFSAASAAVATTSLRGAGIPQRFLEAAAQFSADQIQGEQMRLFENEGSRALQDSEYEVCEVSFVQKLYGGVPSDVLGCLCRDGEKANEEQAICVRHGSDLEGDGDVLMDVFSVVNGEIVFYMEMPSSVDPNIDIMVVKHESAGLICAVVPTGLGENLDSSHLCMECSMCTTADGMTGVVFSGCHGVTQSTCHHVFGPV